MNEEMKVDTIECVEGVTEICEIPEEVGGLSPFVKVLIGLGLITAVGAGTVAIVKKVKKSKRYENWMKKRLEKKGYTVMEPWDDDIVDEDNSNDTTEE